jgi:hypothetical protein
MTTSVLKTLSVMLVLGACTSTSRLSSTESKPISDVSMQPVIAEGQQPQSLTDLPQTQYGGFVLAPGFYEAEFKTYCLQPGTPDPSPGDAYLQRPVTGYRKDIIESVLINSRKNPDIGQRNVQLLLWSTVSGSDFNKLSPSVKADAMKLLTPRQVFELQGGVLGMIKTVSNATGLLKTNSSMKRLFEVGTSSYESFERLAVLQEAASIKRKGVKADQWYKQEGGYYIRHFPVSYKKVRIQVYVPDSLVDADGKSGGDYLVFDPTGQQAVSAFTNAQDLGIGAPVKDIARVIIQVGKQTRTERKSPEVKRPERSGPEKQ